MNESKRVYLDSNVLVSIEQQEFSIQKIYHNICSDITIFPFSSAHIQETDNITDESPIIRQRRIDERFSLINEICKNNYLDQDISSKTIMLKEAEPAEILENIRQVPFAKPAIQNLVNQFPEETKANLRIQVGIDPIRINNYSTTEIIEHFTQKLNIAGFDGSILDLIELGVSHHPDGKSFGLYHRITGVFELLDMFGYWKDRYTERSNVARFWDSSHAYFASFCDYFVSDDRRTRNKVKVAYSLYGISTIVVSSDGEG